MPLSIEDYMYSNLKKIYLRSPQEINSILGRIYRILPDIVKYGTAYKNYFTLLEASQWWSKREIENYQWRKIEQIINNAYKNVPYYKNIFNKYGIKPKKIQDFNDFIKIPLLTKKDIQNNYKELINRNINKSKLLPVGTGGTTGIPLQLYYEKGVSRSAELAFRLVGWMRVGYQHGDRICVIRGDVIRNRNSPSPSLYDPIRNRMILSSYHMTEKNLYSYIYKINNFKPKYLHAYPSSLTILAQYISSNRSKYIPSLKGIFVSSETLYDWQIELFENIFKCRVYSWYGLNELVARAGPCEYSKSYHFFPEYSFVELMEIDKNIMKSEKNGYKEIVGTGFINDAMPLIRYRTFDFVLPEDGKCKCGRNYLLAKKIVGRLQEFFIDNMGGMITFTYADVPLFNVKQKIEAYQYVQNDPGKINLFIEPKREFKNKDKEMVLKSFREIYNNFEIEIQIVKSIPRTNSGKFIYLKQNIKSNCLSY